VDKGERGTGGAGWKARAGDGLEALKDVEELYMKRRRGEG